MDKPTIHELETLLDNEGAKNVRIEPDGAVSVRSPEAYAIEHAEYLAQAVDAYMKARNELDAAATEADECDGDDEQQDELNTRLDQRAGVAAEHFNGLRGAVYEFRKRAERVPRGEEQ